MNAIKLALRALLFGGALVTAVLLLARVSDQPFRSVATPVEPSEGVITCGSPVAGGPGIAAC